MAAPFNIDTGLLITILTIIFVTGGFYLDTKKQTADNKRNYENLLNKIDNHNERQNINNDKTNDKIDHLKDQLHFESKSISAINVKVTRLIEDVEKITHRLDNNDTNKKTA